MPANGARPGSSGERAHVPTDLFLVLADHDLVTAGGGDPRVLEPGRPAADDEHALRRADPVERSRSPGGLAADRRVVDALHAARRG